MTPILLIGTGPMARDYARLLKDGLGLPFVVASRDAQRAKRFAAEVGAVGGDALPALLEASPDTYAFAIVATAIEALAETSRRLSEAGHRRILLEKPGALTAEDLETLGAVAEQPGAFVRIAYNRRYYASIRHLAQLLSEDPALCAAFDFTEWADRIAPLEKGPGVKERWALANSVHVFDTVAHLLGPFGDIRAMVQGSDALKWHPVSSCYVGSARCGQTPVSWCTSWIAPGRWAIEVMTRNGRYRLAPMEQLQVMRPNSVQWTQVELDDALDRQFKPGLYRMVEAFAAACRDGASPCLFLPTVEANAELLGALGTVVGYAS